MIASFHIEEVWDHETSSIPPLFIEMHVPNQKGERSYVCVNCIDPASVSVIIRLDYCFVPTVSYCLFFILFALLYRWNV
jgi:hypothetical protein